MTKRLLIVLLLCSVLGASASASSPAERAETLRAINWVENPTNHTRRGSKGELGPYQFRPQTWRLHTGKSFQLAVVREHADEVAVKHYEWIKDGLREAGIEPTPFNIALAWNSGLGAVQRGKVPTVSYHYAERVANLVESQRSRRAVAAAAPARVQPASVPVQIALTASTVNFSSDPTAPRFALDAGLEDPVVVTDKSLPAEPAVVAATSASAPTIALDAPILTFATTAPRFAILQ